MSLQKGALVNGASLSRDRLKNQLMNVITDIFSVLLNFADHLKLSGEKTFYEHTRQQLMSVTEYLQTIFFYRGTWLDENKTWFKIRILYFRN